MVPRLALRVFNTYLRQQANPLENQNETGMDLGSFRGSDEDLKVTARHELVLCPKGPQLLTSDHHQQRLPVHRPQGPLRRADVHRKGRPDHRRIARHRSRDGPAFRASRRVPDDRRAQAGGAGREQRRDIARATVCAGAHFPSRRARRREGG